MHDETPPTANPAVHGGRPAPTWPPRARHSSAHAPLPEETGSAGTRPAGGEAQEPADGASASGASTAQASGTRTDPGLSAAAPGDGDRSGRARTSGAQEAGTGTARNPSSSGGSRAQSEEEPDGASVSGGVSGGGAVSAPAGGACNVSQSGGGRSAAEGRADEVSAPEGRGVDTGRASASDESDGAAVLCPVSAGGVSGTRIVPAGGARNAPPSNDGSPRTDEQRPAASDPAQAHATRSTRPAASDRPLTEARTEAVPAAGGPTARAPNAPSAPAGCPHADDRTSAPSPRAAPTAPSNAPPDGPPASPPMPPLFDWRFASDPYPAYAWLREHAPVHRTTLPSGVDAWLVTRHADARAALAEQRLSKNPGRHSESAHGKGKVGIPGERGANLMTHLLNIDPPDHTRLRRLVSQAFTPRRVAAFAPRVQALADELIDAILARREPGAPVGEADLIHEFAFPLPIYAICDLLGVPSQDQDDFRDWAGMMLRHGNAPRGGVGRAVKRMRRYLAELIHRKRELLPPRPTADEDLISGLIRASDHGEHLTENEAAAMAFILLFAGFETTVNLIGNGTLALLRHPEQRALLQEAVERRGPRDEALLARAVEELLRFDGPVEMATWRFATEPLVLGGARIAEGDPVLVVLAAADRDPERFESPDTLDLTRTDNQHLGYGHGIHYCLGAPLARLEGRTALATLFRRLPALELAMSPDELRWRGGLIMRGLRTLPVTYRADPD